MSARHKPTLRGLAACAEASGLHGLASTLRTVDDQRELGHSMKGLLHILDAAEDDWHDADEIENLDQGSAADRGVYVGDGDAINARIQKALRLLKMASDVLEGGGS